MREPKRRWALHHVNAWGDAVAWPRFSFAARGRAKAVKKLLRLVERHPGVGRLVETAPDGAFSLRIVEPTQ